MDRKKYLHIPMGIKEKNEFWEGFGAIELRKAMKYIFFSLIPNILISLLLGNILVFMVLILVSIGGSLMVLTKGSNNLSVVDQIENMRYFSKSQKKYYYKSLDEFF